MKKLSVSLDDRHVDLLDGRQDRDEIDSRSEALRRILDEYEDLRTECDEFRTECEDLRTRLEAREDRIDQLEEQLARRSQVEEKVDTLAKRVQEDAHPDPPWPIRWYRWFRGGEEPAQSG
jgi:chromosome segregation ATPase